MVLVFMDNFTWREPSFNGGGLTRGAPTPPEAEIDHLSARVMRFQRLLGFVGSGLLCRAKMGRALATNRLVPWIFDY